MRQISRRFRFWWNYQRETGAGDLRLLALELPKVLLRKPGRAIFGNLNRSLTLPLFDASHREAVLGALSRARRQVYFLVGVPGTLHFVLPCIALVARHVSIIIVSNGLRTWEKRVIGERFPDLPILTLHRTPGMLLPHGVVLDILTPRRLERRLAGLQIASGKFLKQGLPFFDTLDLLMGVALSEGFQVRVARRHDDAFYVGGISWAEGTTSVEYVSNRLLIQPWARPIAARYGAMPPDARTLARMRARLVAVRGLNFLDRIDAAIDRVAQLSIP